jgi:hypothetical protein
VATAPKLVVLTETQKESEQQLTLHTMEKGFLEAYEPRRLATNDPSDEEGDTQPVDPRKGECQRLYKEKENSIQVLLAMAIRLKQPCGRRCANMDKEPYCSVKNPRSIHPAKEHLQ